MCCNNYDWLSIIISILFGIIVGILFAFELIPGIVTASWISLGLSVLTLILLVTGVYLGAVSRSQILWRCLRRCNTRFLLVGIVGTIITSIAALSINLALISSIPVIILVAIGAFFFALMIIGLIFLIKCLVCSLICC